MRVVWCRICDWRHVAENSEETQREWNSHYLNMHYVSPSDEESQRARDRAIRSRRHAVTSPRRTQEG